MSSYSGDGVEWPIFRFPISAIEVGSTRPLGNWRPFSFKKTSPYLQEVGAGMFDKKLASGEETGVAKHSLTVVLQGNLLRRFPAR